MLLFRHILFTTLIVALQGGAQALDGTDVAGIESIVQSVEQPNERWRQEAESRIREHRMADLNITVTDNGQPISNATVRIKLIRHAFRFGGILSAKSMGNGQGNLTAEEYRQLFLDFGFNTAGFGNGFKYKQHRNHEHILPELIDWFAEHNIPLRGHCLIWPGRDHMSKKMTQLVADCKDDPSRRNKEKLRQMCKDQIEEWAPKWDVFEWDVINEPRGNYDVADLLGDDVYSDWFTLARKHAMNPDAGLYLNENRVVSDPEPDVLSKKFKLYVDTVKKLLKENTPITGLGMQSRFHAMTPAETIIERLDELAKFDLPMAATEFEIGSQIEDELDKAIMTERVMTAYFSHPSVNGIYAWSLLPSSRGKGEGREILNADGAPNLRGKIWLYLMKNRWMTNEERKRPTGHPLVRI